MAEMEWFLVLISAHPEIRSSFLPPGHLTDTLSQQERVLFISRAVFYNTLYINY
jgi:hypothetical protein